MSTGRTFPNKDEMITCLQLEDEMAPTMIAANMWAKIDELNQRVMELTEERDEARKWARYLKRRLERWGDRL